MVPSVHDLSPVHAQGPVAGLGILTSIQDMDKLYDKV